MDSHVIETQEFGLYPGDSLAPLQVEVTVKSSNTTNDGFIPYGTSVSSVTGKIYKLSDNIDVTTDIMEGSPTEVDNIITTYLNYPTTNSAGSYGLILIITLNTGSTLQINVPTIVVH
jgi:hypothetical protein